MAQPPLGRSGHYEHDPRNPKRLVRFTSPTGLVIDFRTDREKEAAAKAASKATRKFVELRTAKHDQDTLALLTKMARYGIGG
jgi:hypothetical protein